MNDAFILHRRPYRNTSLLLDCFIHGAGRLPVIAQGAAKNKLKADLQVFQPLTVEYRGKGEVKRLIKAEVIDKPVGLEQQALYCGFYVNELMVRLLPGNEPHDALFKVYWKTLIQLKHCDDLDWQLRLFELALLNELGYAVSLLRTADGEQIKTDQVYQYDFQRGLSIVDGTTRNGVSGETLCALSEGNWQQDFQRREAKLFMRNIMDYYLEYKPLKSRDLFKQH